MAATIDDDDPNTNAIWSVHFEVYGKVQGVFYRKHTQTKAKELQLCGWVRNMPNGSVEGIVQGPRTPLEEFKMWVSTIGSPRSSIEGCNFTDEKRIRWREFGTFSIHRD
ncbi:Acylphosphatase-like domain-containing protein [Cladochytrium replicatum]|nr:Acylphosphatase-like domain-containing protein [Cladochytrium replicatum]